MISHGYCIGCGVCAAYSNKVSIVWNDFGDKYACITSPIDGTLEKDLSEICPFSSEVDETEIARSCFGELNNFHEGIGQYGSAYVGHSNVFRESGSSGGVITHLLARLVQEKLVDHVICVGPSSNEIATYQIASNEMDIARCATSFYFPVSLEHVLAYVRNNPGRYAITGVPCFQKAVRLLRAKDPLFDERIVFQAGIVCGQMKSAEYAEFLARRAGKRCSGGVISAKFRDKAATPTADNYRFVSEWRSDEGTLSSGSILAKDIGANWAMSYFKPKACDYCDDVYAECADFSAMDAWLPEHVADPEGTSVLLVRNSKIEQLVQGDIEKGALALSVCSASKVIQTQEAGLRHRREGVRARLALNYLFGTAVPTKRVSASFECGFETVVEMVFRVILRRCSRLAFFIQRRAGNGLFVFDLIMSLPHFAYRGFSAIRRRLGTQIKRREEAAYRLD